jgi:hypothetical protein
LHGIQENEYTPVYSRCLLRLITEEAPLTQCTIAAAGRREAQRDLTVAALAGCGHCLPALFCPYSGSTFAHKQL